MAEQKANGFKDTAISRQQTVDGDHGRIETRTTTVIEDIAWLRARHRWPGLKTIVVVDSTRETNGRHRCETRYFVSSRLLAATEAAEAVREHWAIESVPQTHTERSSL